MSKGTGLTEVDKCWLVDDKSTVLTMLSNDSDTSVTVDLLVTNFALDVLTVHFSYGRFVGHKLCAGCPRCWSHDRQLQKIVQPLKRYTT